MAWEGAVLDSNPKVLRMIEKPYCGWTPSPVCGQARPDSDIDLLVVLSQVRDKRQAAIEIRRLLADLSVCKDIIVTMPEEIKRRGHLVGTVLRPALREGKVLYERR